MSINDRISNGGSPDPTADANERQRRRHLTSSDSAPFQHQSTSIMRDSVVSESSGLLSTEPESSTIDPLKYRSISRVTSVTPAQPVTLTWEHLNVFTPIRRRTWNPFRKKTIQVENNAKQLLSDVDGIVRPGELVALMGASGAGKTTLLNCLSGRNTRGLIVRGEVCVNGNEIGKEIDSMSAYVQQDDLFIGSLTVREHMVFQGLLRLPRQLDRAAKIHHADETLFALGLRRVQHTKIGIPGIIRGISGGERKRLAFATAILTNPPLLFCDEPTTGLDSFLAESVVAVLQKLAARGKTVICTIHQPASEIYTLFNRVIFLAEGRVAYSGPASEAIDFFSDAGYPCPSTFNPADHFIQTLSAAAIQDSQRPSVIDDICERYEASDYRSSVNSGIDEVKSTEADVTYRGHALQHSSYEANSFVQFFLLLWRANLANFRNPTVTAVRIGHKIVMGLFVGLLYLGTTVNQEGIMNMNGALYYLISELTYSSIFGALTLLPVDFPLAAREHHDRMYSVGNFYVTKVLAYVPVFGLSGLLLVTICYFMIGLNPAFSVFATALLIALLIQQASLAFGIMLSACTPSFPVAATVAGPILTVMSLTGGLYANVGHLPDWITWTQYLSWFRFGFEAFAANQWASIANITCTQADAACISSGEQVLDSLSFNANALWIDCAALAGYALVFYLIGYMGLFIRIYRAR